MLERPHLRALLAAAIVLICSSTSSASAATRARESFSGVVTHVADGDTLSVTVGQRTATIRLEGIDAPERGQPFSAQARTFLRVLAFLQRATVNVKDTDRYGRLVARVLVGGKDLSEQMVAAGLAWHYVEYSSDPRLAALEKQAREKRMGLWADRSAVPPWVARRVNGNGHATPTPGGAVSGRERLPAPPGAANRGAAAPGPYHGNVSSHVYHAPGCRDYDCKNCRQVFTSREQAEAAGYRPHAECVFGR